MYCPTCGSQNQDELKFCTRCGTNLGIIADALSGKLDTPTEMDERLVKLLKDYYRGRRNAFLGLVMAALFSFKLSLAMFIANPEKILPFILLFTTLIVLGLVWLMWGATKWNDASSELKALGYDNPKRVLPKTKRSVESLPESSTMMIVKDYTTDSLKTDSLDVPPTVTEQTTRQLEEKIPIPQKIPN